MKRLLLIAFLVISTFFNLITSPSLQGKSAHKAAREKPSQKFYQLSTAEIDAHMKEISRAHLTTAEKIAIYSGLFLETPYLRGCLGEGNCGKYDKDPLIDLSRVDCMTFCEQVLALAISKDYQDTLHNLQKIRYQHGTIGFITRNHFVMADWLPHNQWLLRDTTQIWGEAQCKEMIKTIDRREFALSLGCDDIKSFPLPQRMSIKYLPKKHLPLLTDRLHGSEILVLITTREGIFASHLGFTIKDKDGSLLFRHASLIHKKVIDEPFHQLCRRLREDPITAGSIIVEVREEYAFPFTDTPQ